MIYLVIVIASQLIVLVFQGIILSLKGLYLFLKYLGVALDVWDHISLVVLKGLLAIGVFLLKLIIATSNLISFLFQLIP